MFVRQLKRQLGNSLWKWASKRHYLRYKKACDQPRESQLNQLRAYLSRNQETAYGQAFNFSKIRSYEDYKEQVPLVSYSEVFPWIQRILKGEIHVLTQEPVKFFEMTSGSGDAAKYIPYTKTLLEEFQRAVGAWIYDLFDHHPELLKGSQYWSLTPIGSEEEKNREFEDSQYPIGLTSDREYFNIFERTLISWVMAFSDEKLKAATTADYQSQIVEQLIRCKDLSLISVWNPSFLILLLEQIADKTQINSLWPQLKLISCWTHGASSQFIPKLKNLLPGTQIQGKGLLATEGVVSFPLSGNLAPVPALNSHFIEFLDSEGRAYLVDELQVGEIYSIVLTTGGGFYRYKLGDRVKIISKNGAMEFIGRGEQSSDLCGEKLDESFVAPILQKAQRTFSLTGCTLLAPDLKDEPHYLLFTSSGDRLQIASYVEAQLRKSFHYDYCRRLRQLAPVEAVRVLDLEERYLNSCVSLGQRPGDVKATYLRSELGWRERILSCDSN